MKSAGECDDALTLICILAYIENGIFDPRGTHFCCFQEQVDRLRIYHVVVVSHLAHVWNIISCSSINTFPTMLEMSKPVIKRS